MNAKVPKIDMKRRQILEERRRRLMNAGVAADQVDQVIAREDYERLPVAARMERLEALVARNVAALSQDIKTLHANQNHLADTMDVNFEAFAHMLSAAGIPAEKQREILDAVERSFVEKRKLAEEAKARAAAEAAEKATEAAVSAAVDAKAAGDAPAPVPEGATVFEG